MSRSIPGTHPRQGRVVDTRLDSQTVKIVLMLYSRSCEKAVLGLEFGGNPRFSGLPHCRFYCLFWDLNVGDLTDSIDWIDRILEA